MTMSSQNIPTPFNSDDIHILVVDGDPVQLKVVSSTLSNLGYKVFAVANGKEGLNLLSSGINIDLILCDVMEGPGFLTAARNDKRFCELPFVMTSSNDQYEIVFNCLSKGADDYMIKPLSTQHLKNVYANVWLKRKQNMVAANTQRKVLVDSKEIEKIHSNVNKASINISKGLEEILNSGEIKDEKNIQKIVNMIKKLQELKIENIESSFQEKEEIPPKYQEFFASQFGVGKKRVTPIVAVPAFRKRPPPVLSIPHLQSLNLGDSLLSINFNSWLIDEKSLVNFANDLFQAAKLQTLFSCEQNEIENFINRTMKAHRPNPFHNFRRGCDCLQFLVYSLRKIPEDRFSAFEKVGLLFAGLLHDVDHPGTNNHFQIHTGSQIALIYNDKSVIQNNTCSIGSKIISESFTFNINDAQMSLLRETFLHCVLQTDYSKLQKFLVKVASHDIDWNVKEDRQHALKLLFLMCDLSFSIRPWDICKYWYSIFRDEQYLQGDMERRIGLPISPFMDRFQLRPSLHLIKTHFRVIVLPVFQVGIRVFPELREEIMDSLERNLNIIEEIEQIE